MPRTNTYDESAQADSAPMPWESRFADNGEPLGVDPDTLADLESAGDILSDWQDFYGDAFTDETAS